MNASVGSKDHLVIGKHGEDVLLLDRLEVITEVSLLLLEKLMNWLKRDRYSLFNDTVKTQHKYM